MSKADKFWEFVASLGRRLLGTNSKRWCMPEGEIKEVDSVMAIVFQNFHVL